MPNATTKNNHTIIAKTHALIYYALAVLVLLCDQISKWYFNHRLDEMQSISVIEPVLNWTLAYNKGAAFSFLATQSGWQKWLFALLGVAVIIFIARALQKSHHAKCLSIGFALVMGGAAGNVLDRVRLGHVVDFIHVHYANVWHYPIFNIADIGICTGMALLIFDALFLEKKRKLHTS